MDLTSPRSTALPEWLSQRARLSPAHVAVVTAAETVTFAELDDRVSRVAGALAERGIGRGDRVAVLCRNGLPFVELAHAIPRLGGILVPLNTRLAPREIGWQIDDVDARALVHDEANGEVARQGAVPVPMIGVAELEGGSPCSAPESVDVSMTRCIIYTSGTTGRAKGVVLTHENFWYSALASAFNLGHDPADRWLAVLPLFHVGGLSLLWRSVIGGNTVVLHERFDAAAVNRAIDESGITMVSAVSTMLWRMLGDRGDRSYPPSLRCVLLGGGPAPPSMLHRCADLGVPVVQTYGLTETCSQAATLPPSEALRHVGSAGKALMTTEIGIMLDGEQAPAGTPGEIVVRGPTVTPGYFNRPEATADALRDGWLHTGDIGYLDPEGFLYILGRRDDLIISGGENVYPAEVEAILLGHPDVEEVGVFGVPNQEWGEAIVAAVVLTPAATASSEELVAYCRPQLAGYKVPKQVKVVDELPRNAAGKIVRHALPDL